MKNLHVLASMPSSTRRSETKLAALLFSTQYGGLRRVASSLEESLRWRFQLRRGSNCHRKRLSIGDAELVVDRKSPRSGMPRLCSNRRKITRRSGSITLYHQNLAGFALIPKATLARFFSEFQAICQARAFKRCSCCVANHFVGIPSY